MSSCSTTISSTTVDKGNGELTSTVHPDIIQTHILTRLDGPTLAAAACASSQLYALTTEEKLWRELCIATWPSINHSRIRHVISTFPAGHRSFFSDSFPFLDHQSSKHNLDSSTITTELISAVDIYHEDKLIYSKVQETETKSSWFLCSPFRVYLLDPKDSVRTRIRQWGQDDTWIRHLEENLTLSWILIDPTRKRAVNVSSRRPVSVQRHWLTGDLQVHYATVMAGDDQRMGSSATEFVDCQVVVTCASKEGEEMHVREVSMRVEDMEGRSLSGLDSLIILERAKKREGGNWEEAKERYEEFVERQREWRKMKKNRERACDLACIVVGVTAFVAFWSFVLFRMILLLKWKIQKYK